MNTPISLLEILREKPDEAAWSRFDALYRGMIHSWLLKDPGLRADAEDLAQEIMAFVCREIADFERQRVGSFRKWLRTITAHRVSAFYRSRNSRPIAVGGEAEDGPLSRLVDDASELSRRWDQEHNDYVIGRMLELLSADFSPRDVLAFRRVVLEEAKAEQVAEELGVTVNVVLLAKSRILARLREISKGLLD